MNHTFNHTSDTTSPQSTLNYHKKKKKNIICKFKTKYNELFKECIKKYEFRKIFTDHLFHKDHQLIFCKVVSFIDFLF